MLKDKLRNLALRVAALVMLTPAGAFAQSHDFVVTTLGTGTPTPVQDRMGAATLVEVADKKLLFDAGRGVLIQLNRAKVPAGSLNGLFLTHLHSDHINGLPDLFLSGWLPAPFGTRITPMNVYGPEGTKNLTDGLTQAYDWDIQHRIVDQRLKPEGVAMNTTEIQPGVVFDEGGVKVTAVDVNHGEHLKPSFGYRVDYDGRSVTISGDTTYDEGLVAAASGSDLLIHQTASAKPELLDAGPAWGLILAHHTNPTEAGKVFATAQPKLAVLYHIVRLTNGLVPAPSYDEIKAEVASQYDGELIVAEDMMRFVIAADGVSLAQ